MASTSLGEPPCVMNPLMPNAPAAGGTNALLPKQHIQINAFAQLEDRGPQSVPRICHLNINRIHINKMAGSSPLSAVYIAVQINKKTYRSPEIQTNVSSNSDSVIDITPSFQADLLYSHNVKKEVNLYVLIQRRNRLKSTAIPGFKNVAICTVSLSLILQRPVDGQRPPAEYELMTSKDEDAARPIGWISVTELSSLPCEEPRIKAVLSDEDESDYDSFSDEEDPISHQAAFFPPPGSAAAARQQSRKKHGARSSSNHMRPPNLKQKIISVLKKMKQNDEEEELQDDDMLEDDVMLDADDLEDNSDSDIEMLDMLDESRSSELMDEHKPSIKPFFSSSTNQLDNPADQSVTFTSANIDHVPGGGGGGENSGDPPPPPQSPRGSEDLAAAAAAVRNRAASFYSAGRGNNSPEHQLNDDQQCEAIKAQLSSIMAAAAEPPRLIVIGRENDPLCNTIQLRGNIKLIRTRNVQDITIIHEKFVSYLHNFTYNSMRNAPIIRVLILASQEAFIANILKSFVEVFSTKNQDLPKYLQFQLLPPSSFVLLRSLDKGGYFDKLMEFSGKSSSADNESPSSTFVERLMNYVDLPKSAPVAQLPISEALLHFLNADNSTKQSFVPFLNYLRLGAAEQAGAVPSAPALAASDLASMVNTSALNSSCPIGSDDAAAAAAAAADTDGDPPTAHGPAVPPSPPEPSGGGGGHESCSQQPLWSGSELQIDCWNVKGEKHTSKGYIKWLLIQREQSNCFRVCISTKEKRPRIPGLKIKKSKDKQSGEKSAVQELDNITRILCTCKGSSPSSCTITVAIDGHQYHAVKFFQVTTLWPTHLKTFPVICPGLNSVSPQGTVGGGGGGGGVSGTNSS